MLEVCVENITSAVNAINGGASRLEVCSALIEGGLTPSYGMVKTIKALHPDIPIFVMLRHRPGNFTYDENDMEVLKQDANLFKDIADGFVFGALTAEGSVDEYACKEILKIVHPMPITFHRAFDWTKDPLVALEVIISLGFQRILTSGHDATADIGMPLIKKLCEKANGKIIIMPGCGVNERNAAIIVKHTGAKELHASARLPVYIDSIFTNYKCRMGSQDRYLKISSSTIVQDIVSNISNMS